MNEIVEITSGIESVDRSSCASISVIATTDGRRCATVHNIQAILRDDRKGTRPWTNAERASLEKLAGQTPGVL